MRRIFGYFPIQIFVRIIFISVFLYKYVGPTPILNFNRYYVRHHSPPEITTQNLWNLSQVLTDLAQISNSHRCSTDVVVLIINMDVLTRKNLKVPLRATHTTDATEATMIGSQVGCHFPSGSGNLTR